VLVLGSPIFRYSATRDAYVLRGIGRRHGPVLQARLEEEPSTALPTAPGARNQR